MQNKRFIILISIVATIIILAFGALFYYSFKKGPSGEIMPAPIELTDFGTNVPPGTDSGPSEPAPIESDFTPSGAIQPVQSNLRQVTNLPVVGATAFEKERLIEGLPALTFSFNQDLKLGDKNGDVKLLQIFLNSIIDVLNPSEPLVGPIAKTGAGSVGREGSYFGEATKKALIRFQNKYAQIADGVFGEATRLKVNEFLAAAPQDLISKLAGPQKNTESVTVLRYVDQLAGNVYESFADKLQEKRVTSTQIFGVQEAIFGNNGNTVVLRYLKDNLSAQAGEKTIESFLGSLGDRPQGGLEDRPQELKGYFLPENVLSLSVSPDKKNIFYLFRSGNSVVGINSSTDGAKRSQIFDSAFSEWTAEWASPRIITLATKPSYAAPGFLYSLDAFDGSFDKILGGIPGLTAKMGPDGKKVLYTDSSLGLKLYDTQNNTSRDLGIRTLPEKCVWSQNSSDIYCAVPQFIPSQNYPDSWYQGEVSFNDSIWKINLSTGAFNLIADPSATLGKDMDGVGLFLSPKNDNLFFLNKKDSILWSLDLQVGS